MSVPQLPSPNAYCHDCAVGMVANPAFLFDPHTAGELKRVDSVTFGRYTHHTHHGMHAFLIYQFPPGQLLHVLLTTWQRDIHNAVEHALLLPHYPTTFELILHGL